MSDIVFLRDLALVITAAAVAAGKNEERTKNGEELRRIGVSPPKNCEELGKN